MYSNKNSDTNRDQIKVNRGIEFDYRESLDVIKDIYDYAEIFLRKYLYDTEPEEHFTLPIDVRTLAENCGFSIQTKSVSDLRKKRSDKTYSPIAQMEMHISTEGDIIGTINVVDTLDERSLRFAVAHELAHFALRRSNPEGMYYIHEACQGLYALTDSVELLADAFSHALLLPYSSFLKLKEEYENDDSRWPVDFSDWVAFLRERAQIPEYQALLAYQNIKRYAIVDRKLAAKTSKEGWIKSIITELLNRKYSKSEILRFFEFSQDEENGDESKDLRQRLGFIAESIELIQDEKDKNISNKKKKKSPHPITEPRYKIKLDKRIWKKNVKDQLVYYGISASKSEKIVDEAFSVSKLKKK